MPTNREIQRLKRLEMIKKRAEQKAAAEQAAAASLVAASSPVVVEVGANLPQSLVESQPVAPLVFQPAGKADDVPGARMARIYARPINVRLRLIEFEDRSHGKLWVSRNAAPMLNWKVWVKPSPNVAGDWEIHGKYNARGTRIQ